MTEYYYGWVRTCLTVASGSVALLVSLQGMYVPAQPEWLWTLRAAWICFAVTVVAALITLKGEWAGHQAAANATAEKEFIEMLERGDLLEIGISTSSVPWSCAVAGKILPWTFALSFIFIATFAVMNVARITAK